MKRPTIILESDQIAWCRSVAAARNDNTSARRRSWKIDASRSDIAANLDGCLGEYGYFTWRGYDQREVETKVWADYDIDLGWDDMIAGKKINIKATRSAGGALLWPAEKIPNFHFFVLAIVQLPKIILAGYVPVWVFQREARRDTRRSTYVPAMSMEQDELLEIRLLELHCRKGDAAAMMTQAALFA